MSPMTTRVIETSAWPPLVMAAAQEVFKIMLGSSLHSDFPPAEKQWQLSALIGLAGELRGLLSLHCNAASARAIAARMLGISPDLAEPEVQDALGELANMIAGNVKAKVNASGIECMISIPTVVAGLDYEVRGLTEGSVVSVPTRFEGGTITIMLQLKD